MKQRFKDRFDEWIASLSPEARGIMTGKISTNEWYPLDSAMIKPTRKVCEVFFDGQNRGAWEIGRFSAEYSLWGLYRLFVKIGSPFHLIRKGTTVFSTYYRPSHMSVVEHSPLRAVAHITEFPEPNELVELRIGGWMERALEISGCSDVQSQITRSMTRGDPLTEFVAEWR